MTQYDTPASQQVDAKLYLAQYAGPSPAAALDGPAGAAAVAAPMAGRAAMAFGQGLYGDLPNSTDTVQSYLMRPYYNLTGGVPVPSSPPPSTPQEPPPPIPPSTQAPQQPSSPPPSTPVEPQPTSPPPSTAAEQQPPSPPPSTPAENTGPQVMESRPLSKWQIQNKVDPNAVRQTQATNPCAALQKGQNGGGSYGGVGGHHMPAQAISSLPETWGPAIQIDQDDHKLLPSTGAPSTSQGMAAQGALAQQDYMKAFDNDAAAVQSRFPGKYDAAIADARAYLLCLKQKGLVK